MDNHFDFLFNNQHIDITVDDNVAWFQGPQVASILGYIRPSDMYRMLSPNEKSTSVVHTTGGDQEVVTINEYGIFRLIMLSRRPEAVEFQNWLYYQVLPSVRRYGAYIDQQTRQALDADPNLIHDLNQHVATLQDQNELLAYSANANSRRAIYFARQADQYRSLALQFQDVIQEIDNYAMMDSPSEFQRIVWDILDDADGIHRLARNIKSQLYHLVDKNKG